MGDLTAGDSMIAFLQGLKRWYLRRFKGFVAAPRDAYGVPRGTSWQEHHEKRFTCRCGHPGSGFAFQFTEENLVVRHREHVDGCDGIVVQQVQTFDMVHTQEMLAENTRPCDCPITDARYCWICPACGLGHWMDWKDGAS
jgi:hypothetical protein